MQKKLDNLTRGLWIALLIIIAFLALYLLRRWLLIPMMVALVLIAVMLPILLWVGVDKQKAKTSGESTGNRKRDRIDAALHEMSDEELIELRERISTGEVSDATLYRELLGEDGDRIYGQ